MSLVRVFAYLAIVDDFMFFVTAEMGLQVLLLFVFARAPPPWAPVLLGRYEYLIPREP